MNNRLLASIRCGLLGLLLLTLSGIAQANSPVASTVIVKDADGQPVEEAFVCFGTTSERNLYGAGKTDHLGHALVNTALPDPPAMIYITASKDGYSGQVVITLSSSGDVEVPIHDDLFVNIELGSLVAGPVCPGDSGVPPVFEPVIQVSLTDILEGELLQLQLFLQRDRRPFPPPRPVTLILESSDPRLVPLPRTVSFRKGEASQELKVKVGDGLKRATSVTLRARLDRQKPAEVRLRVRPRDDKSGGRQRP